MDFILALMKAIGVLGVFLMIAAGLRFARFVMGIIILVVITLILTFMFYD